MASTVCALLSGGDQGLAVAVLRPVAAELGVVAALDHELLADGWHERAPLLDARAVHDPVVAAVDAKHREAGGLEALGGVGSQEHQG